MRVLITGSSGQIGTNLGILLQELGHFVFGVDIRPNTWTKDIETVLQDLSTPSHNFSNGIGNARYPDNLDVVVHLAANAKVHELVTHPARALDNITMTYNVLEFCRANEVPIVFSSSREVYGDIQRYITEESHADFAFTESPYSASKIAGEALVYSYAQCYGLKYLVFRFSNVYGRYDNDLERMERVIPLFIRKIGHDEPLTIYGKDKLLDFTYVDDCVNGILAGLELITSGGGESHVINLAYGQGNSLTSMVEYVAAELDKNPVVHFEPTRLGEVTRYVANIGKARTLLNYVPQTTLKEGIKKSVAWSTAWSAQHAQE